MFNKPPANDFLITHACCGADCPRCPFERLTLDDTPVTIDVDGDTYARLAAAADAAGESVDTMAERALSVDGFNQTAAVITWRAISDSDVAIPACQVLGPFTCTHVGHGVCSGCPTDEQERQWRADEAAQMGAMPSKLQGITDVECIELMRDRMCELNSTLVALLDAFPRLGKDYSGAEQQEALRRARKAVGR